jgi:hypothetical protein
MSTAVPPKLTGTSVFDTVQANTAKLGQIVGDAVTQFGNWKGTVNVASTVDLVLLGEQTIDGVAVVEGGLVLVKSQNTGSQNGLYVCMKSYWVRTQTLPTGSSASGACVYVSSGTANGGKVFICTNAVGSDVVGTNSLTFVNYVSSPAGTDTQVQFNDAGLMAGDAGLTYNKTTDALTAGSYTASTGNITATAGNFIASAGTLQLSSAKAGSVTLAAGTATVNTNVVLGSGDRIFVTRYAVNGGALGNLIVRINATGGAGVASFTITSNDATGAALNTDISKVNWVVVSSAAFA